MNGFAPDLTAESRRFRYGVLLTCCVFLGFFSSSANADLFSFCTGAAPTDPALQQVYRDQCPAYLQSQFSSAAATIQTTAATAQATAATTQLQQQQSQAAILTSYAALAKAPASQISQGADTAPLAIAAQLKDAELTYAVAQEIGKKLRETLAKNVTLLVTPTELALLNSVPVDAVTVKAALVDYAANVDKLKCSPIAPGAPGGAPGAAALGGVVGAEALLGSIATLATMFQPSLLATANTKVISDPQMIMAAGLFNGLGSSSSGNLLIRAPNIATTNGILVALGNLRNAIVAADGRLANCNPKDPTLPTSKALLSDASGFITALVKTDGVRPSLLDYAARRMALEDANVKYTLVLARDVSGGGAAAIKPNWFQSVAIVMGAADGITYQLTSFDGKIAQSGFESAHWTDKCRLDSWPKAFERCSVDQE